MSPRVGDDRVQELRAQCTRSCDQLREFARIHLAIDPPKRKMHTDEPGWIGRMRKICLHVKAVTGCEIAAGVEHVMATELRAAYEQMDVVWKQLPETIQLKEMDGGLWSEEARHGMLATYDHPTPQSLMLTSGSGGFRGGETEMSYGQLAIWLGNLGIGYGLALVHLSQTLGVEHDITASVTAAMHMFTEEPS